ncbi:MAG: BamA/TamA family outer membrane protein, partial [Flavobacteriales bacterium]
RDTLADGVHWHLPVDRDLRPLTQRLAISAGDRFSPEAIAETRQLLRSASLVDRVDLEVSPMPETTEERDWPLELKASITPSPRRLLRLNGGLTSRQQIGGEAKLALSDLDFRRRMERLSLDLQVLAASLQYDADRILPFAADRFPRSNRPRSRLSLTLRDENRPKFSRTFLQLALTEQFIENQATGSRFELRPMEVTLTASRLESGFAQDLEELGLGILASTFASRALFATGASWWYQPPTRSDRPRFSLHLEAEAAGHLFHALDPRNPSETDIPIPSLFGSNSAVEVARYTRWVLDARCDWPATPRFGLHARCFLGVAASTIPGSAVPFEKQFYVGGANSMRGWRALGLGPGRSDATLQGVRGTCGSKPTSKGANS